MTEKMEVLERRMTWLQNREVAAEAVPGNELRLDVKLVSQVRVYLAPGTLDLGRPVRIRVNGRLQGVRQARPSVRFMLEEYRRAGGLYPVYYAKVEIPTW